MARKITEMKPCKGDIRYKIRIDGLQLAVLHKLTGGMCEAFGLDRKIDAYKGTRAITLYAWDLDCLDAVTQSALRDPASEGIASEPELEALRNLDARFRELYATGKDPGCSFTHMISVRPNI